MHRPSIVHPMPPQGRDSQTLLCAEDEYQIELNWRSPVASELRRVRRGELELAFQQGTASQALLYRLRASDVWSLLDLRRVPVLPRYRTICVVLRNAVNGKVEVRRTFVIGERFLTAWLAAYDAAQPYTAESVVLDLIDVHRQLLASTQLISATCVPLSGPILMPSLSAVTHDISTAAHPGRLQMLEERPQRPMIVSTPGTAVHSAEPTDHRAATPGSEEAREAAAEGFITLAEAARRCGLSAATLRSQAMRRGRKLRVERIGKRLLVTTPGWLDAYLTGRDPRGGRRVHRSSGRPSAQP